MHIYSPTIKANIRSANSKPFHFWHNTNKFNDKTVDTFSKNLLNSISFSGQEKHTPNSKRTYNDYDKIYIGKIYSPIQPYSQEARVRAKAKNLNLSGKDFTNYIFTKSNFYRTNFSNSTFNNTNLSMCNLAETTFDNSELQFTDFSKSNLTDASFANAIFNERIDFVGATLLGSDFSNTDLEYANLRGALYNNETIFPEDFSPKENKMIFIDDNIDYSVSSLNKASYDEDDFAEQRVQFEFSKLRYLDLNNVKFNNCSLKRADLKASHFENSEFKNTNLTRAYARECKFNNCNFHNAKMKQINLSETRLKNCDFRNADLRGGILTFTTMENCNFNGALYDQLTIFPENFKPDANGMIFKKTTY